MKTESYVTTQRIDKSNLWKDKKPIIGRLDIELTERCNNNCVHCCINLAEDDLKAKKRELSADEIKRVIREAASLGCMTVRFTGGEPLLREDFEELYMFTRRSGLKVMLFTNATLITPHIAGLLSRIIPGEKIEVTVYGMKRESYEAVTRKKGSFDAAWRGIRLLLEKKIPFIVKGALLPSNKDEMEEFERWAATIPWMDKPPSYSMFFDLRCRREEAKNEKIKKIRLSAQEGLKILTRRESEYIKSMKEFCSKFMRPPGDKLFSCGSGIGGGCLDAYGYFQPCMMVRHPAALYDVKNGTLKEALTKFFPKLRKTKARDKRYLERCARCFIKGLCEQCPAKSWAEYGTLDTPVEYLCEIGHAQALFLGLIEEGEKAWEINDWKKRIEDFAKS